MAISLHVLILEDQLRDAELVVHQLRQAGYIANWKRVDNETDYLAELDATLDLILADYSLPQFDALRALHLLQERGLDVPFIVVTGSLEEVAIECMKQGASDYLLKDRLGRLGQAVERALQQKRLRDEKRLAAEALQENQRAMSTLLGNLPGMAYRRLNDPNWTMKFVSDGCQALTGYQPSDLIDNARIPYVQIIHLEDRNPIWSEVQASIQEHAQYQLVYRIRTAGDEEKWVWEKGLGVYSPDGSLQALEGFVTDITARFRAEEALRNSEELLRQLAENVREVFWVLDARTHQIFYVSPVFEEVTGRKREELFAAPGLFFDIIHPGDRSQVNELIQAHGGVLTEVEFRIVRPDGAARWVEVHSYPVMDSSGQAYRVVGVGEDVTERKEAEVQLRQSALRFQALDAASKALAQANQDLRAVLQEVARQVASLIGDSCGIYLLSEDGSWSEGAAIYNPGSQLQAVMQRVLELESVGLSIRRQVIQSGQSFQVPDLAESSSGLDPTNPAEAGCGLLIAPLRAQGRTLGFIALGRGQTGTAYNADDQSFLQELADRAGLAIANARLYNESLRRLNHLQALREIDMAIAGSVELQITLKIVLEKALSQLRVDAADILIYQPASQMLEFAAGRGFHTRMIESARLRLGKNYAGRVAFDRRAVHITDHLESPDSVEFSALLAAEGFVAYDAVPLLSKGRINGVFEVFHRSTPQPDQEWLDLLDAVAGQAAIAIDNANLFDDLQRKNLELMLAYDDTIEGWSRALDLRDRETEGHTQRVTQLAIELAQLLGIRGEDVAHVRRGALLHDIGKMGVPDHILLKPGPLTDEEWIIMRKHPQFAYGMLAPIAYLYPALDIPYCHHERWDGAGYPRGLMGEQIPLAARLFSVIDVWDAITSDRPYRAAWPKLQALEHIRSLSGTHFDPHVLHAVYPVIEAQAFSS